MNAPIEERQVAEISREHGLKFPRKGVTFDSNSIENLPDDIAEYWEEKKQNPSSDKLKDIAEKIIEKYGEQKND